MTKRIKTNHIHINGRHYDAATGELLHAKPAMHHATNHTHPHAPKASAALMRQAVKKPCATRQYRPRAQGEAAPRSSAVPVRKASVWQLDEIRVRHAKHIKRSHLISHFSVAKTYSRQPVVKPAQAPATPRSASTEVHRRKGLHHLRRSRPNSTAQLLERALEHADSFRELSVK